MAIKPFKPPLSLTKPDVAAQSHPEKNGGVTPEQVTQGSGKKYWWICKEGPDHEWQASVYNKAGLAWDAPVLYTPTALYAVLS